jgi:hypothetical protein
MQMKCTHFCMSKDMWWESLSKHVFWHYMREWLFLHLEGFSTNLMVPFVVLLWPWSFQQIVNPPRLGSNVILIQRHLFCINMWWLLWYHVWVWVTFAKHERGTWHYMSSPMNYASVSKEHPLQFSNINFT